MRGPGGDSRVGPHPNATDAAERWISRAGRRACVGSLRGTTFSADLDEPGRFRIFEEWESEEALRAHFASPHMARVQKAVGGLGVREMAVQRYEVAKVGPLRP